MNTKCKKISAAGILTVLITLITVFPAEAKNNIAFECAIDSFCCQSGDDKSAGMLVDGDINYDTKWETADGANHPGEPHRITLDFGAEETFDSIRLIKASQGAEDFGMNEFDADEFKFEVSADKKSWVTIIEAVGDGDNDIYESSFPPVTARYLRLTVTRPGQDERSGENQTVRLYDLKVFEKEFTEPAEDTEGYLEIDDAPVPPADIPAPPTSDHPPLLTAVWMIISALFVYRIGHGRHKRHFGG